MDYAGKAEVFSTLLSCLPWPRCCPSNILTAGCKLKPRGFLYVFDSKSQPTVSRFICDDSNLHMSTLYSS